MSKKGGGRSQAQLDARSRSMNSADTVGRAAIANQATQATPGTAGHQAALDNRSVQLNSPPAPGGKPITKPSSEGSTSKGSG